MDAKGLANMQAMQDRANSTVALELRELVSQHSGDAVGTTFRHVVDVRHSLLLTRGVYVSTLLRMYAADELWFDITRRLDEATQLSCGPRRRVFIR